MKKYLKHDDSIVTFNNKEELWDYLNFRKENDEWLQVFINEMAAIGVPNEPLFIPQYCTNLTVKKNGYSIDIPDIDVDKDENLECIEGTGLFLVFPYKNKMVAYPTRAIAYPTICQRADDACGTMYRFDVKPNKSVLPINEKAERLTRDYLLYNDSCKILLRDGKVSAALSKDYAILPANELLEKVENQLKNDHPDYTFLQGNVNHEYLVVEYMLNDTMMEESFRQTLNNNGADISTLKAGIRFSTSDTGSSSVFANVFYLANGIRTNLSEGICMKHIGDATTEKFGKEMENLGMVLKESEERIEELGNIEIHNVAGCVEKICEAYTFLPKTISEEVVNDMLVQFPNGGTAIDVYLALNDIIERHAKNSNLTPTRYLNLCEQVAKLMKLPFEKIDKGEAWN